MVSRKLAGAVAAMVAIVTLILGSAQIGGVSPEQVAIGIGAIASLGGIQGVAQATIDMRKATPVRLKDFVEAADGPSTRVQ